jgi:inorganic phosphate transporter, PiT family
LTGLGGVDWASIEPALLVVLALVSAWSMGHHYSGAVLGTAVGSKSVGYWTGVAMASVLVVLGATLSRVVSTYVVLARIPGTFSVAVLLSFVVMTNLTTYFRAPTSTIQLYAFAVLGAAAATGTPVEWQVLALLIASWVAAPLISFFASKGVFRAMPSSSQLRYLIVAVMAYSAVVLGLNDVSNAASSLVSYGMDETLAKVACGTAMALGMITWGGRLVKTVGHELLELDYRKAATAQLTKSVIISGLNALGLNASMNQTIVAALASLGARKRVVRQIATAWVVSPLVGFVAAYLLSLLVLALG